jgi:hypothetical protein
MSHLGGCVVTSTGGNLMDDQEARSEAVVKQGNEQEKVLV